MASVHRFFSSVVSMGVLNCRVYAPWHGMVVQLSDVSVGDDRENVVFLLCLQTKKNRAHI